MATIATSILRISIAALLLIVLCFQPASAITVELAKKCRDMALKAYPPKPIGSKTGNAKEADDYYRNCLANNGAMPEVPAQQSTTPIAPQQNIAPAAK